MSEEAPAAKATILIYSDDRRTRDQIKVALGRRVAADVPELTMVECATHQAAIKTLDEGGIDLVIADGEAVPLGGMGLVPPGQGRGGRLPAVPAAGRARGGRVAGDVVAGRRGRALPDRPGPAA
jgi:DNA-binding NtrC family response regulator